MAATSAASTGWSSDGGAPAAAVDELPVVAGLEVGGEQLPHGRLGLCRRPVGGEAVVDHHDGLVGHHVAGHAPLDGHGLQLLGVLAPVEDRPAAVVAGHGGQQRGQAVDGVAPGVRSGGVGPGPGQTDPHPQRALAPGLHQTARGLAQDGGVGVQEVGALGSTAGGVR